MDAQDAILSESRECNWDPRWIIFARSLSKEEQEKNGKNFPK